MTVTTYAPPALRDEWPDERLFDAWYLSDVWTPPSRLEWPEEMAEWSSREKERWGVLMVKRAVMEHMDGALVIHRGDAVAWRGSPSDGSALIQGDLEIEWEGRSPVMEVKAYLPALQIRGGRAPACQGLDYPHRQDYLNAQKRSGKPFYVVWVWPDASERKILVRGQRIDLLPWPAHEEVWKGRRVKQGHWYVETLLPMRILAEDISRWAGQPFQPQLFSELG